MVRCGICERDFNSKEALEMHNRSKHSENLKRRLSLAQKKNITKYILTFAILAILIFLISWRLIPPEDAPLINLNPASLDFGAVSQSRGAVIKEVILANEGNSDLVIDGMETSCGCTSATLVYEGKESPRFGMANHGTNPDNFQLTIPPGNTAQLKIRYDPNVHKTMRGAVTRSVYITSNDPRNSREEVRINVNQVD